MAATQSTFSAAAVITTGTTVSPANPVSCSLLFNSESLRNIHNNRSLWHLTQFKPHSSSPLSRLCRRTNLTVHLLPEKIASRFTCFAFKKGKSGGGSPAVVESRDFVDEDVDFDFLDEEDDDEGYDDYEDEDEDNDEMLLPFEKMQKRLEKKPRGFGEGKVYDTSIEDKLLEEMQKSEIAQAANVNNLKKNPIKPSPKEDDSKKKASDAVPIGIRVQVSNLPKKRNVQRDLRSAFKGFRGIVDIIPAVSGNKKTKDPVCKGFAFVDFESEIDASRFVKQFSGESIAFGKVQKQIKCRMASLSSCQASRAELAGIDMDDSASEDEVSGQFYDDDEDEIMETLLVDETDETEIVNFTSKSESKSVGNKKGENGLKKKAKMGSKKGNVIAKKQKLPKLAIPGSAKRLKVREKSVLTEVFTKYRLKADVSSKEGS